MDQNEGAEPSDFWSRVIGCCPCSSRRWRSDDSGASAPILHPPTGNLAECLIPPSVPGLYGESSSEEVPTTKDHFFRRGIDPDLHGGSWEINVARENMDSLPHTPRKGRGEQPSSGGNSPGRQPVAIELKETDSNPMLGQFHMENQGQFLKDKWALARKPERKGSSEAHSRREEDLAPILDLEDHVADFGDPILDDLT
eukprot:jgi/Botrbrau1/4924/Bobra.0122s0006.1